LEKTQVKLSACAGVCSDGKRGGSALSFKKKGGKNHPFYLDERNVLNQRFQKDSEARTFGKKKGGVQKTGVDAFSVPETVLRREPGGITM